jgi:ribosomal protein S18 acetylase RimI-like enzyme
MVNIVEINSGNLSSIVKSMNQLFEFQGMEPLDDERMGRLRNDVGVHFDAYGALEKNKIVGYMVLVDSYSTTKAAPTLILHDLCVNEDARGIGVGTALINYALKEHEERGCCRLEGEVLKDNEPARALYDKLLAEAKEDWIGYNLSAEGVRRILEKV